VNVLDELGAVSGIHENNSLLLRRLIGCIVAQPGAHGAPLKTTQQSIAAPCRLPCLPQLLPQACGCGRECGGAARFGSRDGRREGGGAARFGSRDGRNAERGEEGTNVHKGGGWGSEFESRTDWWL
jgi:hypothetical protein